MKVTERQMKEWGELIGFVAATEAIYTIGKNVDGILLANFPNTTIAHKELLETDLWDRALKVCMDRLTIELSE